MNGDIENLDLEELKYKHIILRNLQKMSIRDVELLEGKNLDLTNEVIVLKESIQRLTETNVNTTRLMVNALTNNNKMKEDYRNVIQKLELEIKEFKNK